MLSFSKILQRKKTAHKGDFGRVLVLAGSRGMSGAAGLTGMATLRAGAGLVTLAVPDAIYPLVARQDWELMVRPLVSTSSGALDRRAFPLISQLLEKQDVLAIGPGLGRHPATVQLIHRLIRFVKIPTVLDADALNAIAEKPALLLESQAPLFLTPHEKEFERVFRKLHAGKANSAARKKAAQVAAEQYGVFVVLKGSRTIVAAPDGKVFVNLTGNPGMATAGSGDVLTGVLAGLLGRQKDYFKTACLAVYAHGLAGDLAARKTGQTGLVARDILNDLPAAFRKLEK